MKKLRFNNKIVLGFISFLFMMLSYTDTYCQVTKEWETESVFLAPESIVFDSIRNCLYVSNFNDERGFLKKADTLRNECISKLDMDGNVQEFRWIDFLHNPTGITIFNDKLYIVVREGLIIVDIETQEIEKRIPVIGASFLNDIAVDKDGTIYISDTFKPCIHRIKNEKCEVWYSDSLMNSSNGLIIDNNNLLVGNRGAENLLSISLTDKTTKIISNEISDNIDGIKKCNNGYLLSWKSALYIFEQGNKKLLYELDDKNDFLADFEFIKERKLIIIPQLMSNKVIALKLDD
jgi:sugar lactone lactonase YvrE